jgi:cell division septation protein DedD
MGLKRALFAGLLIASAPALADVKAGVDAWERGDFSAAVTEWRPLAIAGDADAQFNLAQAYKLGRGVNQDLNAAEDWYRKAAAQGHVQAEDNFGLILFQNGKRAEAIPWIRKSADRGEPRAQYVLGTAMFNGDLAEKDWPRAYALMTRSSAQGISQASTSLAQMDKYISDADRRKGLQLARDMEATSRRPIAVAGGVRAPVPMVPPRSTPAPAPSGPVVATTALPPSQAGTSYPQPGARPTPAPVTIAAATPKPAPVTPKPVPVAAPPAPRPSPTPVAAKPAPVVPKPAAVAQAPATAGKGWRIQLGAFSDEARARALWAKASGWSGYAALQPDYEKVGAVTRLRAGPVDSRAGAERLCAAAKAAGNACLVVAP